MEQESERPPLATKNTIKDENQRVAFIKFFFFFFFFFFFSSSIYSSVVAMLYMCPSTD